ncbi:thiamine pyrophosphate-dependent enzyme [Streptomyces sp. NRRL S-87]|uniref:thiamine pyrophosphate-dependent enzyme n=1 Tax=Streptomyces sp. NRRL S-87 TaxID=1463920 RepID=UPI0006903545|nr:thiamine pyrophosphate-dependent enzyme [Streptomyces sp. NRRL S-87]
MAAGLDPERVVALLEGAGFGPYAGVPRSPLGPVVGVLEERRPGRYTAVADEGAAVAVAAGARLAGRLPVVILEASGLGNAVAPLTSLCGTLRLPVLLLVTRRGGSAGGGGGIADAASGLRRPRPGAPEEPHHELTGRIAPELLTALGIRHEPFPTGEEALRDRLAAAAAHLHGTGLPFAFIVPEGAVAPRTGPPAGPAVAVARGAAGPMLRSEAVGHVVRAVGEDALVVATAGGTARALERDRDRPGPPYVVGPTGRAPGVALGVALNAPDRRVVVLDGDGAAPGRLEAMAAIGRLGPPNLLHVLLDDGPHDAAGGRPAGSAEVNFTEIAAACGYCSATEVAGPGALAAALAAELGAPGPAFVRVRIAPGADPRPDPRPARRALPAPSAARLAAEVRA